MGDAAQPNFLKLALARVDFHPQRCMYSGAAEGLAHGSLTEALGGCSITYTDIASTSGVDLVWDLQEEPLVEYHDAFDLFISTSVLEHVQRPWLAARNMETVIKSGGYLYIAVPWVWRYHRYPDDYWRVSIQGS
jgi:SAM-dependent methyltransferase